MTLTIMQFIGLGCIALVAIALFFIGGGLAFDGLRTFNNKRMLFGFGLLLLDIALCLEGLYLLGVFA